MPPGPPPPTPPPPSYGAPPPAPPRPPRPSGWWFALGAGLLVAALASGIGLFVWTLAGALETDATVEADGETHAVRVGTDGDRLVWQRAEGPPADCEIVDTATGEHPGQSGMSGSASRSDGSGSWVGVHEIEPGSGDLEVTCSPTGGPIQIGPAPEVGGFVGSILLTILVPLVLGLAGLVVLVITGVRWATGGPRPVAG